MGRQDRTLPHSRRRATSEDSLLIRSAETLGKMIGALQRQLDGASKKLYGGRGIGSDTWNSNGNSHAARAGAKPVAAASAAPQEASSPRASRHAKPKTKTKTAATVTASKPSRPATGKKTAAPRRAAAAAGKNTKGGRRTS